MSTLSEAHLSMLQASAIGEAVIAARGYQTVTTRADLGRLGFSEPQRRVPSLVIPLYGVDGQIVGYQSRPDAPRVRDGRIAKYETPGGWKMRLDVHLSVRHLLADPRVPLFVTEGIKKGDALASRGCCAVALLGVWNWRGTNEFGGKTVLADWDSIALNDRRVFIVFDSDVMTNPAVHAALSRLGAFLKNRGAH